MITVLIATHNGADTLPEVLRACCRLEAPDGGWKLVVIDNASTDQTRNVIESFKPHLDLTYIFESRKGKSTALNSGLSCVTGDLVVFADDDVLPQADWLTQFRVAADSKPEFSIFGGCILPKWEMPPEDWLLNWVPLSPTFAITNFEEGPIHPQLVFGPNMAIRAEILKNGYQFDQSFGPKGSDYTMGEDTEFSLQLTRAGFKSWHCKQAIVYHIIQSSQMTREWVLDRAIPYGRAQMRRRMKDISMSQLTKLKVSLHLRRLAILGRLLVARFNRNEERVFKQRWDLNFLKGQALQARMMLNSN
jgi:glycosyltransferase involved in cell wall biosynthesis